MVYMWLIAIVLFSIVEMVTAQMVSIWFIVGSIAAFIGALLGAGSTIQWVLFIVVSAITLILTRPLIKRYMNSPKEKTNLDAIIGKIGVVTEEIDNIKSRGQVTLDGSTWSAKSSDGELIAKDVLVKVEKIEGVKLIVIPKAE